VPRRARASGGIRIADPPGPTTAVPTPAEAATAYEAYLTSAFAKRYILGYSKCQCRDAILASGQLKQGLRTVDGELRMDWAASLRQIHTKLLGDFEKQATAGSANR
jgi:hypothetical protein